MWFSALGTVGKIGKVFRAFAPTCQRQGRKYVVYDLSVYLCRDESRLRGGDWVGVMKSFLLALPPIAGKPAHFHGYRWSLSGRYFIYTIYEVPTLSLLARALFCEPASNNNNNNSLPYSSKQDAVTLYASNPRTQLQSCK